jgi:hypothetical protein
MRACGRACMHEIWWDRVLKWGLASAVSFAVADLLGQQMTEHTPFYENGKQRRMGGVLLPAK